MVGDTMDNTLKEALRKRTGIETTRYGIINYEHAKGPTYVTKRQKKHYFIKFKGFGVSVNEIERLKQKGIKWIMISYYRKDGTNIPYYLKVEDTDYLEEYNHEGDIQKILPIKGMQTPEKEEKELAGAYE